LLFGTLEEYSNDGSLVSSVPITSCFGPLPGNAITLVANNITYTCGNILKIINLRLAWTDASKSDCPIDPATINPNAVRCHQ
jgi:hypothetical protein